MSSGVFSSLFDSSMSRSYRCCQSEVCVIGLLNALCPSIRCRRSYPYHLIPQLRCFWYNRFGRERMMRSVLGRGESSSPQSPSPTSRTHSAVKSPCNTFPATIRGPLIQNSRKEPHNIYLRPQFVRHKPCSRSHNFGHTTLPLLRLSWMRHRLAIFFPPSAPLRKSGLTTTATPLPATRLREPSTTSSLLAPDSLVLLLLGVCSVANGRIRRTDHGSCRVSVPDQSVDFFCRIIVLQALSQMLPAADVKALASLEVNFNEIESVRYHATT